MALFFKGQQVKKIQVIMDGKRKLVATSRQYLHGLEGHYEMVGDDRVEIKEYFVNREGKKTLKSTASLNLDDILVEYTYKPPTS